MGSVISSAMGDNMKAIQVSSIERQIEMQKFVREEQMAVHIAKMRDLFHWVGAFTATYSVFAFAGAKKTGNKLLFGPLLPLSFVSAYIAHFAYGGKIQKVRDEAVRIIDAEKNLLALPHPFPTIDDLDERRKKNKEDAQKE